LKLLNKLFPAVDAASHCCVPRAQESRDPDIGLPTGGAHLLGATSCSSFATVFFSQARTLAWSLFGSPSSFSDSTVSPLSLSGISWQTVVLRVAHLGRRKLA